MLTKVGKKFKAETAAHLTQNYPAELARLKANMPYTAAYLFRVKDLETKGYPKKAKNRYKKLDASNRIKLLEDVLADVMGIDDSANMVVLAAKEAAESESTDVFIYADEVEDGPHIIRSAVGYLRHIAMGGDP